MRTSLNSAIEAVTSLGAGFTNLAGGALIIAGGAMLLLWGVSAARQRRAGRDPSLLGDGGRRRAAPRRSDPAASEARAIIRDAEELTQRLAEVLDEKAARLERLIAQADDRLARLDRSTGSSGPDRAGAGGAPPHARPTASSARSTGLMEARPTGSRLEQEEPDPRARQVYALADEGLSPVEIARRMDDQVGRVELILALRE